MDAGSSEGVDGEMVYMFSTVGSFAWAGAAGEVDSGPYEYIDMSEKSDMPSYPCWSMIGLVSMSAPSTSPRSGVLRKSEKGESSRGDELKSSYGVSIGDVRYSFTSNDGGAGNSGEDWNSGDARSVSIKSRMPSVTSADED